jgi:hypothetical protein
MPSILWSLHCLQGKLIKSYKLISTTDSTFILFDLIPLAKFLAMGNALGCEHYQNWVYIHLSPFVGPSSCNTLI